MNTPIQRPASNSESRKRAAEVSLDGNLARRLGEMVADIDRVDHAADHHAQTGSPECWCEPAGLPGYFVAHDGFGAQVIWRGTGPDDPTCHPVLEGWRVQAAAPDLWAAIVALVEGGPR